MNRYLSALSDETYAIWLFHGVVRKNHHEIRNYTRKHITVDYFADLLKELKKVGHAVSIDEIVEHTRTGEPLPPRSFCITFDDGFENNISVAAPVLCDLGIPAIFYVSTDFIDNNTMSWIDRIEYLIEKVPAGKLRFTWSENEWSFQDKDSKIILLCHLRKHVKNDPKIDLDALVSDIYRQLGQTEIRASNDPLDLKMNWDQIRSLNSERGLQVAGHSHHHVNLAFLNQEDLDRELDTSLNLLKEKAGISSNHYCYPEGLEHCYSKTVIEKLKMRGIVCSPTAIDGVNRLGDDLFHLRRIMVT